MRGRTEEKDEIDQSLYSSVRIKAGENNVNFFGIALGLWNEAKKKKLTHVDTNMWCSATLVSGQEFLIEGIRFKDRCVDKAQREHLLQYAYFFLRIADRDFLIYPYHLMENYFFYVERRLTRPLWLPEYFNFNVLLQMDQPFDKDIDITCELMGKLSRPG